MRIKTEKEFLDEINNFRLDPVYLLVGGDTERKKGLIRLLRSKISDEFDFLNINSQSESIDMLLSDLLTPPLFSPKRVIVLDDFQKLKSQQKKSLFLYLTNPLPSTVLFLLYNEDLKNYEIKKEFESYENTTVVAFNPLTEEEIKEILLDFFTKNDIKPQEGVIDYIAGTILNFSQLKNELEKLLLYLDQKKNISLKEIKELIPPFKEINISEISDHILHKDKDGFIKTINQLISQKEEPLYIISSIENTLEKILKIKTLLKKYPNPTYEIYSMLSINRFEVEKMKYASLQSFSDENILEILELCLQAENSIKSTTLQNSYLLTQNLAYFIVENLMNS